MIWEVDILSPSKTLRTQRLRGSIKHQGSSIKVTGHALNFLGDVQMLNFPGIPPSICKMGTVIFAYNCIKSSEIYFSKMIWGLKTRHIFA